MERKKRVPKVFRGVISDAPSLTFEEKARQDCAIHFGIPQKEIHVDKGSHDIFILNPHTRGYLYAGHVNDDGSLDIWSYAMLIRERKI